MRIVPVGARSTTTGVLAVLACCLATAFLSALLLLTVLPKPARAAEACPNETARVEQGSTALPDCRAYELVTPANKESDEPTAVKVGLQEPSLFSTEGVQASVTGERLAWTSEYILPGSKTPGVSYLSTRGTDGWSSENVIPPQSVENGLACPLEIGMVAYSSDLSKSVLADGAKQPGSFFEEASNCGHDEPRLAAGELPGFQNLFLRDNNSLSFQLVDVTPPDAPAPEPSPENQLPQNKDQYYPASFLAGSKKLDHVVFEEELPLTANAGSGDELYEWTAGTDYLVTVLPNGTAVHGTLASATRNVDQELSTKTIVPYNIANFNHAVSEDGLQILFEAEGNLYARENAEQPVSEECSNPSDACTVQVDGAQGGPGVSGGGKFRIASEDGSKVFFTDESRLTIDSNAETGKPDLYEYDFARPVGQRLSDLTPDAAEPANVLGVSGAASDGSYVYFVAEGVLTSAHNSGDASASHGEPNLYLSHDGATTFIATLDAATLSKSSDSCDWMSAACTDSPPEKRGGLSARVSTNGAFIGFNSDLKLTGYNNVGDHCVPSGPTDNQIIKYTPGACEEIFLYDAEANTLACASCGPDGVAPVGPAVIRFPAPVTVNLNLRNAHPQHNVSNAGQVFFETGEPLVRSASNGKLNVYEYQDGQHYLISGGTGEADSYFLDATPDGSDVFFATAQPLVRGDGDSVYDIYDAHTDGGFPEPPVPGATCEAGCKGAGGAGSAAFSGPGGSATFSGAGNLAAPSPTPAVKPVVKKRCRKGYVRKRGRCVRAHKAKAGAKTPATGRKKHV